MMFLAIDASMMTIMAVKTRFVQIHAGSRALVEKLNVAPTTMPKQHASKPIHQEEKTAALNNVNVATETECGETKTFVRCIFYFKLLHTPLARYNHSVQIKVMCQ